MMGGSEHFQAIDKGTGGDVVGGDKLSAGSISRSVVAMGRDARVTLNQYTEIIIDVENFEDQPPAPGEPPYKGLAYFTEKDKDIFIGREQLSDQLADRLHNTHFLALIGASGSGKSSLLRAGVIPRLREHNWIIHVIKPGAHPLSALAATLTTGAGTIAATKKMQKSLADDPETLELVASRLVAQSHAERLLMAIDQFEELFTQCEDADEAAAFVDNLVHAVQAQGATTVLLNMRADFYDRVNEFAVLTDLVSQQQEYVKPMAQDALVRVIAEPAKRGGWQLVERLVEQIVKDVGSEPGRLPLLSHALLETWKRRSGVVMTLGGYWDAGGVEGAIAQTADEVYESLSDTEQLIARQILVRLTQLGGPGTPDSRRPATRADLELGLDPKDVDSVLDRMVQKRLLTMRRDETAEPMAEITDPDRAVIVEVAHEALIRNWPQLREWLDEDREGLLLLERVRRDARVWQNLNHDPDVLYRGIRLAQAQAWAKSGTIGRELQPGTPERAFLDAGQKAQNRRTRRRRLVLGALSILAVLLLFNLAISLVRDTQGQLLYQRNRVWALASMEDTFFWGTGDIGVETYKITLPTGPDSGLQCGAEALAIDRNDTKHVYAAVEGQGLYHSTNGGEKWEPLITANGVAVEKQNDTRNEASSCSEVGPLPGNTLIATGIVDDLDVANNLLIAIVREFPKDPIAFISQDLEKAQSIEELACSNTNVPEGVATAHLGQDGHSIYVGAHDGLFKGVWQPGQHCWRWEQVFISEQIVDLEGVAGQFFWITTASEVFHWQEGQETAAQIATLAGRLHALAPRQDGTAVYVLVAHLDLLAPLDYSIQSVMAVTRDGEKSRLGWQPGLAYDLMAVPDPVEESGSIWVLMAHKDGVYRFTDETDIDEIGSN